MAFETKGLTFIGKGRHGEVYRIDETRCVKLYRKKAYLEMEFEALKNTDHLPYFPKVFECTGNYMVREYFDGPDLMQYIQANGFTRNIASQLLGIIEAFIQLGYSRIDCRLPHIIVTHDEQLKIIDPTRNKTKQVPYPVTLLKELGQMGYKEAFLKYTKELRPDLYSDWIDKK